MTDQPRQPLCAKCRDTGYYTDPEHTSRFAYTYKCDACTREALFARIAALEHECQEHQGVAAACEQRAEKAEAQVQLVQDERAESFARLSRAVGGVGMTEYQAEVDLEIECRIKGLHAKIAELETQRTEDHETMLQQAEETADEMERAEKAETHAAVLRAQIENLKGILNNEQCDSQFERQRAEKAEALVAEIHNTPKSEWEKRMVDEGRQAERHAVLKCLRDQVVAIECGSGFELPPSIRCMLEFAVVQTTEHGSDEWETEFAEFRRTWNEEDRAAFARDYPGAIYEDCYAMKDEDMELYQRGHKAGSQEGRQTGLEEAAQKVTTIGFPATAALIRGLAKREELACKSEAEQHRAAESTRTSFSEKGQTP